MDSDTDTLDGPTSRRSILAGASALFASAALLLLAGCGGGGGGGGGGAPAATHSAATFNGAYRMSSLSLSQTGGNASGYWVRLTAAGDGTGTFNSVERNVNGAPTPLVSVANFSYSVSPTGVFTFGTAEGQISADGRLALITTMVPGNPPRIWILVREGAGLGPALLTGDYHYAGLESDNMTNVRARWSDTTLAMFNGAGAGLYGDVSQNENGLLSTVGGGAAFYGLAPTGLLTTSQTWFGEGEGGIRDDGYVAAIAGSLNNEEPFVQIMVRAGAGLSNATWQGAYTVVGLRTDASSSNEATAIMATLQVDGAGNLQFLNMRANDEGAIGVLPDSSETYSVAANGAITSGVMRGAIAPDGSFGYVAGEGNGGGDPSLFVFLRNN